MILHGRAAERAALEDLVERARAGRGGALLLHGDAGIGKTVLLRHARAVANQQDLTVLTATGTRAEQPLAFAALHHLLLPVLDRAPEELRAAFGLNSGPTPDLYRIALATLELLADAAPAVALVDDVQWLDAATADVLAFVARRLAEEPIVLIAAARSHAPDALPLPGVPAHALAPLDDRDAAALLDGKLAPELRARVLEDAAGNPLALVELPRTLGGVTPGPLVPLTQRLEHAFAGRAGELPAATQALLLVAAAEPACSLGQLLSAAGLALGAPCPPDAATPAIDAGVLDPGSDRVRFRHPLMASGVYQAASARRRHAVHTALASVLVDDPDRQAWHRATATLGTDEGVADALEATAERAARRGAVMASVTALERAATLTGRPGRRDELILRAAEQACDLGRHAAAATMVADVDPARLDVVGRARRHIIRETVEPGDFGDDARLHALTTAAVDVAPADRHVTAVLLALTALRAWWGSAPDALRAPVVAAARGLPAQEPRRLAALAFADPLRCSQEVLEALAGLEPDPERDPHAARFLGGAALIAGDFPLAARLWSIAAQTYRRQGRLALLARTVISLHYTHTWTGEWDRIEVDSAEGAALAAETGEAFWGAVGQAATGHWLGMRGDHEAAERAARAALTRPAVRGVRFGLFTAQLGLAHAAGAANRHAEAYALLRQCFDPASPVFHRDMRFWVLGDLVELAVRAGTTGDARALVEPLAARVRDTTSPRIRVSVRQAAALLDPSDAAFADALAHSPIPLDRARIQLAYGMWLRRERRYGDSRPPLRAAQETFAALGATAWTQRAAAELAASGEVRRTSEPATRDELTPQERQIATLAAQGLTNREIAQHLFLSPRTVSTHLYRVYQKLGISSRAAL